MACRKRQSVTGDGWSATEHRANPANNSGTSKNAEPLPVKSNSLPTSVRGEAGGPSGWGAFILMWRFFLYFCHAVKQVKWVLFESGGKVGWDWVRGQMCVSDQIPFKGNAEYPEERISVSQRLHRHNSTLAPLSPIGSKVLCSGESIGVFRCCPQKISIQQILRISGGGGVVGAAGKRSLVSLTGTFLSLGLASSTFGASG